MGWMEMKVKGYDKVVDIVNNYMGGQVQTENGLDALVRLSGEANLPREKAEPFVHTIENRLMSIDSGYLIDSKYKYIMTYEIAKTVVTVRIVMGTEFGVRALKEWVIKFKLV